VALPIDPLLPRIVAAVAERRALVLQAEPGAGKTTRVPAALLDAGAEGEVWVLEPRRIAARMAARRVAEERGERPGETVGYQVRFEEQASAWTRLRFVTEGILTRRLVRDPSLEGVSTVVLDEFHERHLEGDLALALLARLQRTARPDLRLVVMSATLDVERVARFLGGAPVIAAPGRVFDVKIDYRPGSGPLEERVRDALGRLEGPGDVLVFLPGAGEIRRAIEACSHRRDLVLLPLHGSLSAEEQDRALRPAGKRKAIFATNVAETSLTVEGVTAVIDSGLARIAGQSPWSGLPFLEVEPISRASATQRAGRAGRLAPGTCVRLYARSDLEARAEHASPEIERLDLAQLVLELRGAGIGSLDWLDPPPGVALESAERLLAKIGALAGGAITSLGERMLRYPLHPRLARMVAFAEESGVGEEACALAALLGEREIVRGETGTAAALLDLFAEARSHGFAAPALAAIGIDPQAARAVDRVREQLARIVRPRTGAPAPGLLARSILAGYPDRVAKRRGPREVLLADGSSASADVALESEFLVAIEAREARGRPASVRLVAPIEPDWLLDAFPESVRETVEVTWDARSEKVLVSSRLVYGALVLDESSKGSPPEGEVERILLHHALLAGPGSFSDREALESLRERAAFARTLDPSLPELGDAAAREALRELVPGRRSFAELRAADLLAHLRARLAPEQRLALERLAPAEVVLPGGRRVRVHYATGQGPWIESRIQDFFGMAKGPTVGQGRVPLVLHLLAPSQRPVQITSDLAGFWENHYPRIRRELSRRYPKHAWPEEPRGARPPPPRPPRRG
jgi:ATP-dependent helicase HrpB